MKRPLPRSLAAVALAGVFTTMAAAPGAAASITTTYAEAQFIAGANGLGDVVNALGDALEENGSHAGSEGPGEAFTQSPVQALDQLTIPVGDQVTGSEIGAAGNYARTTEDGAAKAASGVVTRDGIVHVGGGTAPADQGATLHLGSGALEPLAEALADVRLELGAVTSFAEHDGPNTAVKRGYDIAGADLVLEIPALAAFGNAAEGLPDSSDLLGDTLTLNLVTLCQALEDGITGAIPDEGLPELPGATPGEGDLCSNIPEAVATAVQIEIEGFDTALEGLANVTGQGVVFDFSAGTLTVDLAAAVERVLGTDINNLPPNTDLVAEVLPALLRNLDTLLLDGLYEQVLAAAMDDFDLRVTLGGQTLPIPVNDGSRALRETLLDPVMDAFRQGLAAMEEADPLFEGLDQLTSALSALAQIVVNVPDVYTPLRAGQDIPAEAISSQTALRVRLLTIEDESQLADLLLANSLVSAPAVVDIPTIDDPDGPGGGGGDVIPQLGSNDLVVAWLAGVALVTAGGLIATRKSTP